MIGVGRNIEKSRVIPGGGTILGGAEAADVAEGGPTGGVDPLAIEVLMGEGIASLFAYRRSSLDREGDGKATRVERLERPDEESRVNELSIVEYDIGVEDSCVVGVRAVFTVRRLAGEKPSLFRDSSFGVEGSVTIAAADPVTIITINFNQLNLLFFAR